MEGICYADAEARFAKYMDLFKKTGEYEVDIAKKNIAEIFEANDRENYYTVKIQIIVFDEKTKAEKRTGKTYLTHADNIQDAANVTDAAMKGTMADYEIVSVSRTDLLDILLLKNETCKE